MRTEQIGDLSCTIFDPADGARPERIVVLCHGFGAPGTDLVPLAAELQYLEPALAKNTRFVFPAAPQSLDSLGMPGGRAWWMIDMEHRFQVIERGEFELFRKEFPDGMAESSDALLTVVRQTLARAELDASRLILGGFSQGSMVATDVALRMEQSPAGLAVLSGTLLCEDRWKELAAQSGKFPVLQSHGQFDPILPYICAEWLKEFFEQAGFPVDFRPFRGMHQIPPTAMEGLAQLIQQCPPE